VTSLQAIRAVRTATTAFFDALEQELGSAVIPTSGRAPSVPQASGKGTPAKAVPLAPVKSSLPAPVTAARHPAPQLTDDVREENLPVATAIAVRVMKIVGSNGAQLVAGVKGQLALERIPHDDVLVSQAIEAAKRQV
jgi:hypothetical protein